ncbi:pentapeptide repeat-containing protein [Streptomyces sp. McG8]|uniref:pentapeptide repeat-containing protein n=1 Tax=Streptomyces sp. McG8 TaxID=2725487 RepID=UPI001BE892F8
MILSFIAAALSSAAVFYTGWHLLGVRELKPVRRIDSSTLFDLVKLLAFGVVAGAGALVALVVAYRRQRVDEDGALREATRLHTERFTTAVAQLGDPSEAVRLGGVHALAGLANDAPTRDLRQTCIDVLCAYLRLPYVAEGDLPLDDVDARHSFLALREVRHTIIRIIRDHLRLPADRPHSWQGHDFDFTGVAFDGGDFSEAVFSAGAVSFQRAIFLSGFVSFRDARFCGASVNFNEARFLGGTVTFRSAEFCGSETFALAEFAGVTGAVQFSRASMSGGQLNFVHAGFLEGAVRFPHFKMTGGTLAFTGSALAFNCRITFFAATFSGGTVYTTAEYEGGRLDMSQARGEAPEWLPSPRPSGLLLPEAWERWSVPIRPDGARRARRAPVPPAEPYR